MRPPFASGAWISGAPPVLSAVSAFLLSFRQSHPSFRRGGTHACFSSLLAGVLSTPYWCSFDSSKSNHRTHMKPLLTLLTSLLLLAAQSQAATKPNILYIVADDMGYADCGIQGCKDVPTPNVDSIANQGIRFTDAYVTGTVCSPTRAALLTGRYHYRDGIHDW